MEKNLGRFGEFKIITFYLDTFFLASNHQIAAYSLHL